MEKRIIEVTGLSKSFGSVDAVKGIDFYVEAGKLFAFLGPNGAGKSTTIDMALHPFAPRRRRVLIDGHLLGREDDEIRRKIGVVFQDSVLDPLLSVRENLLVRARLYGSDRQDYEANVRRAIETAGVEPFLNRRYGKLSGGQRRRTDIARALVNTPKILFLDEPTTGLDPQTKKNVWETIRALQKENNMTVFLTTHYMEEAAGADYIMIIDNGEIVARGTPGRAARAIQFRPPAATCLRPRCAADKIDRTRDRIHMYKWHMQCSPARHDGRDPDFKQRGTVYREL